jgi:geranylgeranyl transferase type-2 subunit beta
VNLQPGYLQQLTIRLGMGLERVAPEVRQRHAAFLKQSQRPDGGFAGRMGDSDLYYTSFALRALAILGELYGETAQRALNYLRSQLDAPVPLIDQMSLVYGAALLDAAAGLDVYGDAGPKWKSEFAQRIGLLRRDDGGFAKGPEGVASSTYYTFLSLLCLELIEHACPEVERAVAFIRSQHDAGGGFREIRAGKRAGTNPTAAAIGVLRMLGVLDESTRRKTADFLCDMPDDDGGLLANSRIPIADILSTFTGVLTLADIGRLDAIDTAAALRFAQSLQHPEGGFLAAMWDETCDIEYTFYGLGCLALLSGTSES